MFAAGVAERTRERNRAVFDGAFGRAYSFYTERERLSRLIAAVVWGGDIRPFYASMGAIGTTRDGGTIVDAPCGAGVAFRGLDPGQQVRYIALDLSRHMVERARRRAGELGLAQIEFVVGDAESVPVEDGSVDLYLSYFGLHCFPDPRRAVAEIARCLRPGGRVVGSMLTRGPTLRQRLLVQPGRGGFGPGGTPEELRAWLGSAGLRNASVQPSGVFAYFNARKPG
jgi:ubiquinone/menaquinone biosynthesis C-methylase UbiE